MNHFPDDELLSAYLDGELTPDEQATVDGWLTESAEHRQLLEELRSLSQSLESLPRLQLEDNFYQSVLRRAEREMLSSQAAPADGGKPSVHAMVERAVKDAAATKPNGEPIAARREAQGTALEDCVQPSTAGRRFPWPRGRRPWIYAGAAIAAGLLVMLVSPPPMDVRNVELAKNIPANGRGEIGNRDHYEAQEGVRLDAAAHSDLAMKSADRDLPDLQGPGAANALRRRAAANEQNQYGGTAGGGYGGGARGLGTNFGREAGEADAKPRTLGDVAGGRAESDRLNSVAGLGGFANGVANKNLALSQAGEGMFADGVTVVEVTLTPEGLNSDAIKLCFDSQQIVLEDGITPLDGTANANGFYFRQSAKDLKAVELLDRTVSASAPAGKPSGLSSVDKPTARQGEGSEKDGRAKDEAAKAKGDGVLAGAAPGPAEGRALEEALPGGLAANKRRFGQVPPSDGVELVEVEAETDQIAKTLAYLHTHSEYFAKVDVRPATVESHRGWLSFNRDVGEQVNEQVKRTVLQREAMRSFHDEDNDLRRKSQHDAKQNIEANSVVVEDKLVDKQSKAKKLEKAASGGIAAPSAPVSDLQGVGKQMADKQAQDLREERAAKKLRNSKIETPGPQPLPTSPAPVARKPQDAPATETPPAANAIVGTKPTEPSKASVAPKPTVPPPTVTAAPSARPATPEFDRGERKAGDMEADAKNRPLETSGSKDEGENHRALGRAYRYYVPYEAPVATNAVPEIAPALQQRGAATANSSQPARASKGAQDAAPAKVAPTNAPSAPPSMPAAPTAAATASPPASVKSESADAKRGKLESETLHERNTEAKQPIREPDPNDLAAPRSYQRAVIVIRVQPPAPVVTGPAPAATLPAAQPVTPAAKQ